MGQVVELDFQWGAYGFNHLVCCPAAGRPCAQKRNLDLSRFGWESSMSNCSSGVDWLGSPVHKDSDFKADLARQTVDRQTVTPIAASTAPIHYQHTNLFMPLLSLMCHVSFTRNLLSSLSWISLASRIIPLDSSSRCRCLNPWLASDEIQVQALVKK
jgi:hypothetical protein